MQAVVRPSHAGGGGSTGGSGGGKWTPSTSTAPTRAQDEVLKMGHSVGETVHNLDAYLEVVLAGQPGHDGMPDPDAVRRAIAKFDSLLDEQQHGNRDRNGNGAGDGGGPASATASASAKNNESTLRSVGPAKSNVRRTNSRGSNHSISGSAKKKVSKAAKRQSSTGSNGGLPLPGTPGEATRPSTPGKGGSKQQQMHCEDPHHPEDCQCFLFASPLGRGVRDGAAEEKKKKKDKPMSNKQSQRLAHGGGGGGGGGEGTFVERLERVQRLLAGGEEDDAWWVFTKLLQDFHVERPQRLADREEMETIAEQVDEASRARLEALAGLIANHSNDDEDHDDGHGGGGGGGGGVVMESDDDDDEDDEERDVHAAMMVPEMLVLEPNVPPPAAASVGGAAAMELWEMTCNLVTTHLHRAMDLPGRSVAMVQQRNRATTRLCRLVPVDHVWRRFVAMRSADLGIHATRLVKSYTRHRLVVLGDEIIECLRHDAGLLDAGFAAMGPMQLLLDELYLERYKKLLPRVLAQARASKSETLRILHTVVRFREAMWDVLNQETSLKKLPPVIQGLDHLVGLISPQTLRDLVDAKVDAEARRDDALFRSSASRKRDLLATTRASLKKNQKRIQQEATKQTLQQASAANNNRMRRSSSSQGLATTAAAGTGGAGTGGAGTGTGASSLVGAGAGVPGHGSRKARRASASAAAGSSGGRGNGAQTHHHDLAASLDAIFKEDGSVLVSRGCSALRERLDVIAQLLCAPEFQVHIGEFLRVLESKIPAYVRTIRQAVLETAKEIQSPRDLYVYINTIIMLCKMMLQYQFEFGDKDQQSIPILARIVAMLQERLASGIEICMDLHVSTCRKVVFADLDSTNWLDWHAFKDEQHCSYGIVLWNYYLQGVASDLFSICSPALARHVLSGVLTQTLSALAGRYFGIVPNRDRAFQFRADILYIIVIVNSFSDILLHDSLLLAERLLGSLAALLALVVGPMSLEEKNQVGKPIMSGKATLEITIDFCDRVLDAHRKAQHAKPAAKQRELRQVIDTDSIPVKLAQSGIRKGPKFSLPTASLPFPTPDYQQIGSKEIDHARIASFALPYAEMLNPCPLPLDAVLAALKRQPWLQPACFPKPDADEQRLIKILEERIAELETFNQQ